MEKRQIFPDGCFDEDGAYIGTGRRCEFDIRNEQIIFGDRRVDLLFVGDSITHFMEECQFYHKYGYVVNRGIGGDNTDGVRSRFAADVLQLEPRLCVIQIGANDLWGAIEDAPGAKYEYPDEVQRRYIEKVVSAHRYFQEEARAAGLPVWIGSLLPQGGRMPNYPPRNRMILRINRALKALSEEFGTRYLDYHAVLKDADGITILPGVSREGIHPNHAGYELMRQVLEPQLMEYLGIWT